MLVRGADRLRLQIIEKLFFEILSPRESVRVLLQCADKKNRLRIIDALLNAQLGPKLSPSSVANLTLALRKDDEKKGNEKAFNTETIVQVLFTTLRSVYGNGVVAALYVLTLHIWFQFGWGRTGSGLSRMAEAARDLLDQIGQE